MRRRTVGIGTLIGGLALVGCDRGAPVEETPIPDTAPVRQSTRRAITLPPGNASAPLMKVEPIEGLSIEVPASFGLMSRAVIQRRYPAEGRPSVVYTSADNAVNVAFLDAGTEAEPGHLADIHRTIEQQFRAAHPAARWQRSEVGWLDGREVFVLELTIPTSGEDVHNILLGAAIDGRLVMVTFSTTERSARKWLDVGYRVIRSAAFE